MRIQLLDNITGKWAMQWIVIWFICGVIALSAGFWLTTDHTALDMFYLGVSFVGLVCVVSLSFRKNVMGNGLGMAATAGEVVVQATSGAVGLMLAPLFNFFTHVYGIFYWSKHTDPDGDMIPKSANKAVWLITAVFIILGLALFPTVNSLLASYGYAVVEDDNSKFLGFISFFWINVIAFVLSITAQAAMILRYSFNWWLWIIVNFVWLIVNLMSGNYIFAIQTMIYQINAFIGLYEWQRSEQG
ncbi:nicotinamide riboside transporter PnuC [Psychrobacter alimentarius]|uniref:nicotinamide riboside transporter PnuC n=1 Tax=Psychrobacter TaxID=497 RepID=UPI000BAB103F|nr:nicotinamide riboside transporter PnuC [Psychrobacter sp. JB193]PAT62855.1 nicotinamide mononucleotide transporter [Psychrobacter sp. JB193]